MRTTIDFPEHLLRQAKVRAAEDGVTLKALVTRFVEQGLSRSSQRADPARRQRSDLPVVRSPSGKKLPSLSNSDLYQILDDEEIGRGNRR